MAPLRMSAVGASAHFTVHGTRQSEHRPTLLAGMLGGDQGTASLGSFDKDHRSARPLMIRLRAGNIVGNGS